MIIAVTEPWIMNLKYGSEMRAGIRFEENHAWKLGTVTSVLCILPSFIEGPKFRSNTEGTEKESQDTGLQTFLVSYICT